MEGRRREMARKGHGEVLDDGPGELGPAMRS